MAQAQESSKNTQSKGSADAHQFLSFILGDEEFGVEILRVQEIKGWEKTTLIPNMPTYVKGVINLRGSIVPVVDLRQRFNFPELRYDDSTVVIIVRTRNEQGVEKIIGLVVDGVSDVYSLDKTKLQPPPSFHGTVDSDYIQGLATVGDKMVIILDIDPMVEHGIMSKLKNFAHNQAA